MELIGRLLKMATNSLNQEFNRFAQQYDLTGTQMSVIDFMANCESQECDQHMLEREFNIKRSTTTVIIQRLVKNRFATVKRVRVLYELFKTAESGTTMATINR